MASRACLKTSSYWPNSRLQAMEWLGPGSVGGRLSFFLKQVGDFASPPGNLRFDTGCIGKKTDNRFRASEPTVGNGRSRSALSDSPRWAARNSYPKKPIHPGQLSLSPGSLREGLEGFFDRAAVRFEDIGEIKVGEITSVGFRPIGKGHAPKLRSGR